MENRNRFPIEKFMQSLSEILSDKHGAKITITATPKDATADSVAKKAG
jgi:hypothetical protein